MHRSYGITAAASLLLATSASAQTLDDLRDSLSNALEDTHFAKGLVGLVLTSDELELSGGLLAIDDGEDTDIRTFSLPFQRTVPVSESGPRLYFEGAIGYSNAEQRVADIFDGADPMLETSVETNWITLGALAGAGVEFDIGDEVTVAPILNVGIARLENETDYAGPGAAASAVLLDGIAFNWDAVAVSYGAALRAEWGRTIREGYGLSVIGRYDVRWTDSIETDDDAQSFSTRAQIATVRGDVTGPTGLRLLERDLNWRTTLGYRHFVEGDLFEIKDYVTVGGALEMPHTALDSTVSVNAALILGEDLVGYSVGVGLTF
ncbi:MAG: hypothetical protein KDA31_14520 [Phycisphaerales bacterium]|nr:hypothetical protein [Phycisphaerales bacterium]MCB9837664.1 hypothetical protein [Phycisphaera sp.]